MTSFSDLKAAALAYTEAREQYDFWQTNGDHLFGEAAPAATATKDKATSAMLRAEANLLQLATDYAARPDAPPSNAKILPYDAADAAQRIISTWSEQTNELNLSIDGSLILLMFGFAQELENAHYWGGMGAPLDREGQRITRGFAMLADISEAEPEITLERLAAAFDPQPFPPPQDDEPDAPQPTEKTLSAALDRLEEPDFDTPIVPYEEILDDGDDENPFSSVGDDDFEAFKEPDELPDDAA